VNGWPEAARGALARALPLAYYEARAALGRGAAVVRVARDLPAAERVARLAHLTNWAPDDSAGGAVRAELLTSLRAPGLAADEAALALAASAPAPLPEGFARALCEPHRLSFASPLLVDEARRWSPEGAALVSLVAAALGAGPAGEPPVAAEAVAAHFAARQYEGPFARAAALATSAWACARLGRAADARASFDRALGELAAVGRGGDLFDDASGAAAALVGAIVRAATLLGAADRPALLDASTPWAAHAAAAMFARGLRAGGEAMLAGLDAGDLGRAAAAYRAGRAAVRFGAGPAPSPGAEPSDEALDEQYEEGPVSGSELDAFRAERAAYAAVRDADGGAIDVAAARVVDSLFESLDVSPPSDRRPAAAEAKLGPLLDEVRRAAGEGAWRAGESPPDVVQRRVRMALARVASLTDPVRAGTWLGELEAVLRSARADAVVDDPAGSEDVWHWYRWDGKLARALLAAGREAEAAGRVRDALGGAPGLHSLHEWAPLVAALAPDPPGARERLSSAWRAAREQLLEAIA
jgi:hypothetical protein